MSLYDDVEREAVHDWLDERPPRWRPATREDYDPPTDPPEGEMVLEDRPLREDDGLEFRCPQCGVDDHDWWDHPL